MTSSNEAIPPLSSTATNATPGDKKITPKTAKAKKSFAYVFAIVIALIATCCAIYAIIINMQLRQNAQQQLQNLQGEITRLQQQQKVTQTKFDDAQKNIHAIEDKFQKNLTDMDKHLQTALEQRLYQAKDWLLLKARYYLELAQINAHWSNNTQTTVALLKQADVLLADMHDQRLFAIRQSIANEIAQLNAMTKVDVAGLLGQLDAALTIVNQLPLRPAVAQNETASSAATGNETSSSVWQERLKNSVGLLEKLVVIRRHDEDILPLPSPAYEALLRESIRLNLQEAQWALLQNNETIYQFSLAQGIKNIHRSFEPHADSTKALIKQLQALQQIHLIEPKPILEQALPQLNQLIELKNAAAKNGKAATGANS